MARDLLNRLETDCATYAELVASRRVPMAVAEKLGDIEELLRARASEDQERTLARHLGGV